MTDWLIDTFLWTGALIALVLLIRRPVARLFGPKLAYALWSLPFLRLLLPPIVLPGWMAPQSDALIAEKGTIAIPQTAIGPTESAVFAADPALAPWLTPSDLLLPLWLGGAAIFLAWRWVDYRRMKEEILEDATPVGDSDAIALIESSAVSSPVAFGVRDKIVALPTGFMSSSDTDARDLVIEHELQHHKGHDLLANFAAQAVLALHWFNPLAWAGWRAMRRDQEAACDARVIAQRGQIERAAYGEVIASYAAGPNLALAAPMACPMLGEKSVIHRLRSLNMSDVSTSRRVMGRALLIGTAIALPLTATISYATEQADGAEQPTEAAEVESYTIIDVEDGAYTDDPELHTKVIERDGKKFVLKTTEEMSDAEAEARIAKAEASRMEIEKEIELSGDPGEKNVRIIKKKKAKDGHDAHEGHEKNTFVWVEKDEEVDGDGKARKVIKKHVYKGDMSELTEEEREKLHKKMMKLHAKEGGEMHRKEHIRLEIADGDGATTKLKIKCKGEKAQEKLVDNDGTNVFMCKSHATGAALDGLKTAREKIAKDPNVPDDVRAEALRSIDEEIRRLKAEA